MLHTSPFDGGAQKGDRGIGVIRRFRNSIARLPVGLTRTRKIVRGFWRDTRGVSLAIIALMTTSLLSMLALSIDLGHLYVARSEAQRAADAAALAGASAFFNYAPADVAAAKTEAEKRAVDYANANPIRGVPGEVTVAFKAERSVTVTVRREAVPLWFAQLIGVMTRPVAASATAGAVQASSADCVAPLAFEYETILGDDDDYYWDQVHGRTVVIAPEGTGDADHFEYVWVDLKGASPGEWEQRPRDCHSNRIHIRDPIDVGIPPPSNNWADELYDEMTCDDILEEGQGWSSSRIIKVMLFSESDGIKVVEDFLLFCVETADIDNETVHGTFLAYASGTGQEGPSQTTLTLRLTR